MAFCQINEHCRWILGIAIGALLGFGTESNFTTFAGEPTYQFQLVGAGQVIARDGPKTGFPSVVRVPDWVPIEERAHPRARYYLYYGTHHGQHIYMKWAEDLNGKWEEFNLGGTYHHFSRRGVFDIRSDSTRFTYGHIAAPDVHIDHEAKQFIMIYHGQNQPATVSPQGQVVPRHHENFVATSRYGLNFNDPLTCGGERGHGPRTVTVDGITRDICIGPSYQRAFQVRGEWYSLSKRAQISKARDRNNPFAPDPDDPFGIAWISASKPTPLWGDDARTVQQKYFSPAAAFLASSEFENHPNNPHPGTRILSFQERINHLSVCLLPKDLLEVFFYVRQDPSDRYNGLYRVLYDVSDPDFRNWDVWRDEQGRVEFEEALSPEEVLAAVRIVRPNFKPMYHADPVSLGTSGIFIDDDGEKYLFFSYVSQEFSGEEGEGQIAAVRLIPRHGPQTQAIKTGDSIQTSVPASQKSSGELE